MAAIGNTQEYQDASFSSCALSVAAGSCAEGIMSLSVAKVVVIAPFHEPIPIEADSRTKNNGQYKRLNAIGCLYARNVMPVIRATRSPETIAASICVTPNK